MKPRRLLIAALLFSLLAQIGDRFEICPQSKAWAEDEGLSAKATPPLNLNFKTRYLFTITAVTSDYPFNEIKDLFIDSKHEELFVLDNGNKRVVITGLNGVFLYQFKYIDAGVKNRPVGIAAAEDGLLYIAEQQRVVVTSYRGVFKRIMNFSTVPDANKMSIQSIAVDEDRVYLGDVGNNRIVALDRKKDEFITQFKDIQLIDKKSKKNRLMRNFYIAAADDGMYVDDPANFAIFRLDKKDGKPLAVFGIVSSLAGGFSMPIDMTVDRKTGRVIVVDWNRLAVIVFDKEGEFLFEVSGSDMFRGPNAVGAYDNRIYVADGSIIRVFLATEETLVATETEPDTGQTSSPGPEVPKDRVAIMAETKGMLLPVYFPEGSITFKEADGIIMDNNIKWLKENPDAKLDIRGYADDRQSEESNLVLSEERAKTAVDYMARRGIDPKRLTFKGYGKVSTGAGDADMPGKRVEFLLVK